MLKIMHSRGRLAAVLVGAVVLCAGCASDGDTIPANRCIAPAKPMSDYVIGPGDTLQVVVWRNDELSTTVPVRPDGKVSTPLVDDMQAAGKTPTELALDIEILLAEYLRSPDVSVIVTGQGAANQIQVVGEVEDPQALAYRAGIRILDVVVAAGGLAEFAAANRANLVRESPQGQIKCRIRIKDLMSGDMSQNILVYPGDVLVVPESRF